MAHVTFRDAHQADAGAVAALHAASWQKHYRGAYSDAFLDGDVLSDRLAVWTERMTNSTQQSKTHLAEIDGELVGFVHTVLDVDPRWGALLDNLHVLTTHQRQGIGAQLMARSGEFVTKKRPSSGLFLWVLEQNDRAQCFYEAQGGERADAKPVPDPGGVPGRLNGSPRCIRYVWPDPSAIDTRQQHDARDGRV